MSLTSPPPGKLSSEQVLQLYKGCFEKNKYPNDIEMDALATHLKVDKTEIVQWFRVGQRQTLGLEMGNNKKENDERELAEQIQADKREEAVATASLMEYEKLKEAMKTQKPNYWREEAKPNEKRVRRKMNRTDEAENKVAILEQLLKIKEAEIEDKDKLIKELIQTKDARSSQGTQMDLLKEIEELQDQLKNAQQLIQEFETAQEENEEIMSDMEKEINRLNNLVNGKEEIDQ